MTDAIQQIIDLVKSAAPVLWQAAYRQVYIDGIEYVLFALLFLGISVFGWRWFRKNWDDTDEMVCFFGVLGVIVSLIMSVAFLTSAIDDLANPTFQAIHYLAGLVKK